MSAERSDAQARSDGGPRLRSRSGRRSRTCASAVSETTRMDVARRGTLRPGSLKTPKCSAAKPEQMGQCFRGTDLPSSDQGAVLVPLWPQMTTPPPLARIDVSATDVMWTARTHAFKAAPRMARAPTSIRNRWIRRIVMPLLAAFAHRLINAWNAPSRKTGRIRLRSLRARS